MKDKQAERQAFFDFYKKKKEKEKLEIKILETKDYEIIKRDLNTTSCYEFKIK